MIVIIAGMQRSGSTFSYNVARELLDVRGGVTAIAANSLQLADTAGARHTLVKTHAPDEALNRLLQDGTAPGICTVRKPEDAIASWMQVFGFSLEESVATYRQWLGWHQAMHRHMLNLRYEEIDRRPLLAIRAISRYLVQQWGLAETLAIWWRYRKRAIHAQTRQLPKDVASTTDIGFSHYDNRTFFHRRHVSSLYSRPATALLPPAQVRFIRAELGAFLDAQGQYHWD